MSDATGQIESTPKPRKFRRRLIPAVLCWIFGVMTGLGTFFHLVVMAYVYVKYGMDGGYAEMNPASDYFPSLKNCAAIVLGAVWSVIGIEAGSAWMRKDVRRAVILSLVFVGGIVADRIVRELL